MIDFAVKIDGVTKEGEGKWVFDIDPAGERLLVVLDDQTFKWFPMAECTLSKMVNPERVVPVVVVQPGSQGPQRSPIVLPNRAERRRMEKNGGEA